MREKKSDYFYFKDSRMCILRWLFLVVATFFLAAPSEAQRRSANDNENDQKIRDMVGFLQLMLNTLGSAETSVADKEVIITQSYSRIFRDDKVQVEDDLSTKRTVITNKDVVAYLKDVDFFFTHVEFEFNIEKIEQSTTASNQLYYKVFTSRNISGTTIEGETVNSTIPRFIEINFDPKTRDLKIVSIYTNEFDETEALRAWWSQLSFEWRRIFRTRLDLSDSVSNEDLKNIVAITRLDVSANELIQTIDPLARLTALSQLNLSGTAITDLTPIRNLTDLQELDISNTGVSDLSPLKYASSLKSLNLSQTSVSDLSVVAKMPNLTHLRLAQTVVSDLTPLQYLTSMQHLDMRGTPVKDLSALQQLDSLQELDLSNTAVVDLSPLAESKVRTLHIDSTGVTDLQPLKSCDSLEVISANNTGIADLTPLAGIKSLRRIYCDRTKVTREAANQFMSGKPGVLVVSDSRDLRTWWDSLPVEWRSILSSNAGIGISPTKEELVILTHLDSINLDGQSSVSDLEPLRRLHQLRVVIAANTGIRDLLPLESHSRIAYLDLQNTRVTDLSVVRRFRGLSVLMVDQTPISSIEPLFDLRNLKVLYADHTFVNDINARELLDHNPDCLVIYKTAQLNQWWKNITGHWVRVFHAHMDDTTLTRENLHRLVEQETIQFSDIPVKSLSALGEFVRLKRLHISGTHLTRIEPLQTLESLESLQVSNCPLRNIDGIKGLNDLKRLDLSNTPLADLRPVAGLKQIERLNISGTQVKKLDPVGYLPNLRMLNCANTPVRKLRPVVHLSLETLTCFNTKVARKEVERFAALNPNCEIVYYR